jgi:hypothetical protein
MLIHRNIQKTDAARLDQKMPLAAPSASTYSYNTFPSPDIQYDLNVIQGTECTVLIASGVMCMFSLYSLSRPKRVIPFFDSRLRLTGTVYHCSNQFLFSFSVGAFCPLLKVMTFWPAAIFINPLGTYNHSWGNTSVLNIISMVSKSWTFKFSQKWF